MDARQLAEALPFATEIWRVICAHAWKLLDEGRLRDAAKLGRALERAAGPGASLAAALRDGEAAADPAAVARARRATAVSLAAAMRATSCELAAWDAEVALANDEEEDDDDEGEGDGEALGGRRGPSPAGSPRCRGDGGAGASGGSHPAAAILDGISILLQAAAAAEATPLAVALAVVADHVPLLRGIASDDPELWSLVVRVVHADPVFWPFAQRVDAVGR